MKSFLIPYLFLINLFIFPCYGQGQEAPNLTFTDINGESHTINDYLEQGYKVMLEYSYKGCYPCKRWALDVGHPLWETHGPNGDNTLRMFYIDPKPVTDEYVAQYTEEWDIQYPVINIDSPFPEYPAIYFPKLYFICTDKSYYPNAAKSMNAVDYYLNKVCEGVDLNNNIQFFGADEATSSTVCDSDPFYYSPRISVLKSDFMVFSNNDVPFFNPYDVQIFINGDYHSTQTLDPAADQSFSNSGDEESFLDPIPVNLNDEVTMVIDFEGDNYPHDDTLTVVMPSTVNTPPTSSHTKLAVEGGEGLSYVIYDSNFEIAYQNESPAEFELSQGSCYNIVFKNVQHFNGALKNRATGDVLLSYQVGDFTDDFYSPTLFFNVISTSNIDEGFSNKKVKDSYYLNLLGKRLSETDIQSLPKGIFLKIIQYDDGQILSNKVYNK